MTSRRHRHSNSGRRGRLGAATRARHRAAARRLRAHGQQGRRHRTSAVEASIRIVSLLPRATEILSPWGGRGRCRSHRRVRLPARGSAATSTRCPASGEAELRGTQRTAPSAHRRHRSRLGEQFPKDGPACHWPAGHAPRSPGGREVSRDTRDEASGRDPTEHSAESAGSLLLARQVVPGCDPAQGEGAHAAACAGDAR